MVWRRVLVPGTSILRELHGMIQLAMEWEGIHLYQFCLRFQRYGSWQVSASPPDVTLASLKLRKGARFTYEYDLNIPWRHEVRIEEDRLDATAGKAHPTCIAGDGACPPEDCCGPRDYLAGLDDISSWDALNCATSVNLSENGAVGDASPAEPPVQGRHWADLTRSDRIPADPSELMRLSCLPLACL